MSNLYKGYNIVSKDKRVIDYNDVIREKIQRIREEAMSLNPGSDGFVKGLQADVVEALISEGDNGYEEGQATDNQESTRIIRQHNLESAKAESDEILRKANEEAQQILENARVQAENINSEAYNEGMAQGLSNAQQQIDDMSRNLMIEYSNKEAQLKKECDEMKAQMEPELVETLLALFQKIFGTIAEDSHDIIINLISSVISNAGTSKEFVIKVSPEDYKFVVNNQGKIYCSLSKDIQMDIVEDSTLGKNECMIETEAGVYNCGLDIQMENLIKDIKLLSCI